MDNLAAYTIPALVEAAANGFGDKVCRFGRNSP